MMVVDLLILIMTSLPFLYIIGGFMQIEEGKFYFIKDDFFELFSNYDLMTNKENGIKRPCYLCFKDNIDEDIIWFIPISHKVEKYRAIYEKKRKK